MANPYIPFAENRKEDIEKTLEYITGLTAQKTALKDQISDIDSKLEEAYDFLYGQVDLDINKPGTFHFGEQGGACFTAEIKTTYTVDVEKLDEILEKHPEAMDKVGEIISFTPKLEARKWKGSDEETRKLFTPAVTTKASKPTYKGE